MASGRAVAATTVTDSIFVAKMLLLSMTVTRQEAVPAQVGIPEGGACCEVQSHPDIGRCASGRGEFGAEGGAERGGAEGRGGDDQEWGDGDGIRGSGAQAIDVGGVDGDGVGAGCE